MTGKWQIERRTREKREKAKSTTRYAPGSPASSRTEDWRKGWRKGDGSVNVLKCEKEAYTEYLTFPARPGVYGFLVNLKMHVKHSGSSYLISSVQPAAVARSRQIVSKILR